jgi:polysaccharide deacetylase 2 family uncharacterized protein YibQ
MAGAFQKKFLLRAAGILLAALLWAPQPAPADPGLGPVDWAEAPAVAIIIDDLGRSREEGLRVAALPGPVACAFLPHAPYTRELARRVHATNKEVVLHLPMHSVDHRPLDAGGLTLDMTQDELIRTLQEDLAAVPHVSGINNHMGSLLTRHPGHMMWLMHELRRHERLFFVDSRTTVATVARQMAQETGVPAVERDVFLDSDPEPEAIRVQFDRLLTLARKQGFALGIGHPYASTLDVLESALYRLEEEGVRLVAVSELIELQKRREAPWRVSWSR